MPTSPRTALQTEGRAAMKEMLRDFIRLELLEDDAPLGDDENLLADGMVSSLGMLRLVGFIEIEFGIRVPPDDFTVENFRSLDAIESYLARSHAQSEVASDG